MRNSMYRLRPIGALMVALLFVIALGAACTPSEREVQLQATVDALAAQNATLEAAQSAAVEPTALQPTEALQGRLQRGRLQRGRPPHSLARARRALPRHMPHAQPQKARPPWLHQKRQD